jgi:hypothetical protein
MDIWCSFDGLNDDCGDVNAKAMRARYWSILRSSFHGFIGGGVPVMDAKNKWLLGETAHICIICLGDCNA